MLLRWLIVAALAGPPAPPSVEAAEVGRARAEAGQAAFAAGDYAEAIRLFEAADAIDPRPAYRYSVAIARAEAGALRDAAEALEALPDYPPAAEALARVEARLLAEQPPVTVLGAPPGSRMTLGGHPLPGPVPVGTHELRVEHPTLYPYRAPVEIIGGAPVDLRPRLARRAEHGALRITLADGWRARIGGRAFEGPVEARHIARRGRHTLTVDGPGGRAEQILAIIPGRTLAVEAPADVLSPTETAGYTVAVGGGVALATGLGLLLWTQSLDARAADLVACASQRDPGLPCTLADAEAAEDRAYAAQTASIVALGIGAAAAAAGALIVALDDTLPVWIGPAGVGGEF